MYIENNQKFRTGLRRLYTSRLLQPSSVREYLLTAISDSSPNIIDSDGCIK